MNCYQETLYNFLYLIEIVKVDFLVAAFFYEFAVVSNYDYSFSMSFEIAQDFADLQHVRVIQTTCWLIKEHYVAAACYSRRYRHALFLAA